MSSFPGINFKIPGVGNKNAVNNINQNFLNPQHGGTGKRNLAGQQINLGTDATNYIQLATTGSGGLLKVQAASSIVNFNFPNGVGSLGGVPIANPNFQFSGALFSFFVSFPAAVNNGNYTLAGYTTAGSTGDVLKYDATTGLGVWTPASSGSGTVTSVSFTGDGTVLSSTASTAVTSSGTVTAALKTQTHNTILAGPATGSGTATPTFRAIVPADFGIQSQAAVLVGPSTGSATPTFRALVASDLPSAYPTIIQSNVLNAAGITCVNLTDQNVTSITLPVGTWKVEGNIGINGNSTIVAAVLYTNDTSAAEPDGSYMGLIVNQAFSRTGGVCPTRFYTVTSGTKVVYLSFLCYWSSGTAPTASGHIYATQVG